jgi:predicted nucleic acid-binding protein
MIVVDTDVASELMRPAPEARVVAWVRAQDANALYTTSITVAEIAYGIERLPDGARKALLRATAAQVFSAFAEHVLAFDADAASLYGTIVSALGARCPKPCDPATMVECSRPERKRLTSRCPTRTATTSP